MRFSYFVAMLERGDLGIEHSRCPAEQIAQRRSRGSLLHRAIQVDDSPQRVSREQELAPLLFVTCRQASLRDSLVFTRDAARTVEDGQPDRQTDERGHQRGSL